MPCGRIQHTIGNDYSAGNLGNSCYMVLLPTHRAKFGRASVAWLSTSEAIRIKIFLVYPHNAFSKCLLGITKEGYNQETGICVEARCR